MQNLNIFYTNESDFDYYDVILSAGENGNWFPCDVCGRVYLHKRSLTRHLRYECGKAPQFSCPYCPNKFKRKGTFQSHLFAIHGQSIQNLPETDQDIETNHINDSQ